MTVKATRTLNVTTGHDDRENTFKLNLTTRRGVKEITAYLFHDPKEDKYWIMQRAAAISDSYTPEQQDEQTRLVNEKALNAGSVVDVNGRAYWVFTLGDYSDCGYLCPVGEQ